VLCGGSRIRTLEGISRRIYSPLHTSANDPAQLATASFCLATRRANYDRVYAKLRLAGVLLGADENI
jgi:hypothetical protein